MPWFKADDGLPDNRKVRRTSTAAMGLWVLAGTWSAGQLTDGFVPKTIVRRWDSRCALAKELVRSEMWVESMFDGELGYQFTNWHEYQPTKAEVEAERAAARERMKRRRAMRKTGERSSDVPANSDETSDEVRSPRPHPHPDPSLPKEIKSGRKRPAIPIPDDWQPNDAHRAKAIDRGLDADHEAEQMRHWALSKDERKVDWDATFHGWLGRGYSKAGGRGVASGQAVNGRAWQE